MGTTIHTIYPSEDGSISVNDTEVVQATAWSNVRDKTSVDSRFGYSGSDDLQIRVQVNNVSGVPDYYIREYQSFLAFDTSGIVDTDTLTDVDLSLVARWGYSGANVTQEIYDASWTSINGHTHWMNSSYFGSATLLATYLANDLSTTAYTAVTKVGTALLDHIDVTGTTKIGIITDAQRTGTKPADGTTVGRNIYSVESASYDPKLVVTSSSGTTHSVAATINASGDLSSGTLTRIRPLAGAVNGSADLNSGALISTKVLAASMDGTADLVGALGVIQPIFTNISASASISGGLISTLALGTAISGSANLVSTTLWLKKGPNSQVWVEKDGSSDTWTEITNGSGSWTEI